MVRRSKSRSHLQDPAFGSGIVISKEGQTYAENQWKFYENN